MELVIVGVICYLLIVWLTAITSVEDYRWRHWIWQTILILVWPLLLVIEFRNLTWSMTSDWLYRVKRNIRDYNQSKDR